ALEADGYNVDVAGSGAEALEAAAQTRYDVVFMDVRMPVMDGLEATQRIRALPGASAKTPIIAVTADVDPDLEAKARAVGVSLVASKPIDPAGLRALAKDWALGAIAS
ncbi:MAG: response regulator, partial [Pseudomonadota bacterium]